MSLNTIVDTTNPTQSGLLDDFLSPGSGIDPDLVFNDILLSVSHRPVKPSVTNYRPWDDDFITGDTFQLAVGNPGAAPSGGTFALGVQRAGAKTIAAISMANPTHITCTAHGLSTGDLILASGTNSTPVLDGIYYSVTVIDANTFSVPVNVTVAGTAGTFVSFNTSGLTLLPWNIPAATLTTALSTVSTAEAYGAVTATLLTNGNYSLAWATAGAVPILYASGSGLLPQSVAVVSQIVAGSGTTEALQIFQLEQSPVAYCEPATPFPAASITAAIAQHGATAVDKVYTIGFTPGTYDGTFSIAITNIAGATASITANANDSTSNISVALNQLANISPGDLGVTGSVSGGLSIQFQGTQKNSDAPLLAVANINLQAPLGVSGSMSLNTVNLYIAFSQTTADTLPFTLAIRRTRADGEQSEYFLASITLKRNLINGTILVPLNLASYYTEAQTNAAIATAINAAFPPWVVETGSFTAAIGGRYQIDTSGGAVTMTLPIGMVAGNEIQAQDATLSWGANALTVAVAASGLGTKINGGTSSYTDGVVGDKLSLVAISSGQGVSIK